MLEETNQIIQKYDLIIMGDFNAKIGKEEYQKKVAGKYSIHDISNENGNLLGQFATRNGKGKDIPVTGRGGPWGCERSRLPHYLDKWLTDGGKVVSPTRPPHFTPRFLF
jgi:hypothetical protein